MTSIPDQLVLCVWRALLGEVFPNLRAIALSFRKKVLTIRYYVDGELTEPDQESIDFVLAGVSATMDIEVVEELKFECVATRDPIGTVDPLDQLIFAKKE